MAEFLSDFFTIGSFASDDAERRDTARENSARPAIAEHAYLSAGVGQQRVKEPLLFPVVFRTQPHFTFGSAVIKNPLPSLWHDPVGMSGVWAWKRDTRGFFTGAFIWWRVDVYVLDDADASGSQYLHAQASTKVQHFLAFSGIAFKDLPKTSSDTLTPRTSGLNDYTSGD